MKIMNKINVIAAMLLIALVSSLALAQGGAPAQQQTTKGAVIKGKAPVNKEVLKVKLPRAEEATLKNGLQVILLPSHKVPTFNMQLVVLSGGLSDKPDYRGLASFTASLLREGTTKRSSKDIAERINLLGDVLDCERRSLVYDEHGQHEWPDREPGPDARSVCRRHSQPDVPAG